MKRKIRSLLFLLFLSTFGIRTLATPLSGQGHPLSENSLLEEAKAVVSQNTLGQSEERICAEQGDEQNSALKSVSDNTIEEEKTIKILLVGNSYTNNEIPGASVLLQLERLALENQKKVIIKRVSYFGAKLLYYAQPTPGYENYYERFVKSLRKTQWDYIVLQDYSKEIAYNYDCQTKQAAFLLRKMIYEMNPDAKVLLSMTPGYPNRGLLSGKTQNVSEEEMGHLLGAAYQRLGMDMDAVTVYAGMQLMRAKQKYSDITFFVENDKHPTPIGYTIFALCLYHEIFGESPAFDASDWPFAAITQTVADDLCDMTGQKLSFDEKKVVLQQDRTARVHASALLSQKEKEVSYFSLDPQIASVNRKTGMIQGKKGGVTCIVAKTKSGLAAYCMVVVEPKLAFGKSYYQVGDGDRIRIAPTENFENLTWTSNNKAVATIDRTGMITSHKPGKTTISVQSKEKPKNKASFDLYVACAKPTGLTVTLGEKQKQKGIRYRLSWDKVKQADSYDIYRASRKKGTYQLIGTTKKTYYVDDGLASGKQWYYKVRATTKYALCDSADSSLAEANVKRSPSVKVTGNKRKTVTLSWKPVAGAKGYVIYRSKTEDGVYRKVRVVSKKEGTRIRLKTNKKRYYYKVIALSDMKLIKM